MSDSNQDKQIAEKASKPFYKNLLTRFVIGIGISLFVVIVVFLGYRYGVQLPKAKQVQAQLEIEFKAITPLPNASIAKTYDSYEPGQALVDVSYLTDTSPTDILNYYDTQLGQHGWQFKSAKNLGDWDQDLGMKIVDYCKGDYTAELALAGQKANYGWAYTFSVSWGLDDCK